MKKVLAWSLTMHSSMHDCIVAVKWAGAQLRKASNNCGIMSTMCYKKGA